MARWKPKFERVVFAADLPPCECCGEPWCPVHLAHFADCPCIGPTEEGVFYQESADGLFGYRLPRRK